MLMRMSMSMSIRMKMMMSMMMKIRTSLMTARADFWTSIMATKASMVRALGGEQSTLLRG